MVVPVEKKLRFAIALKGGTNIVQEIEAHAYKKKAVAIRKVTKCQGVATTLKEGTNTLKQNIMKLLYCHLQPIKQNNKN